MVSRVDLVEIRSPKIDQNGYLVADAFPTKVGVFKYVKPNGEVTRELRHPDDVFKPDSLETLKNRPIVDEHPNHGPMNSGNTRGLSRGHVGEQISVVGDHVKANVVITDQDLIAKMQGAKGGVKKNQLSCGYTADVIEEAGTFKGQDYDHRQTNIVYNHLASVWKGRAGPTAAIHLDAEDAAAEGLIVSMENDIRDAGSYSGSDRRKKSNPSNPGNEKTKKRRKGDSMDLPGRRIEDGGPGSGPPGGGASRRKAGTGNPRRRPASQSKPPEGAAEKRAKKVEGFVGRRKIAKTPQTPLGPKVALAISGVPGGKRKDDPESIIHDEDTMTIKFKKEAVTHGDYRQDAFTVEFPAEAENAVNQVSRRLDSANSYIADLQEKNDNLDNSLKKSKGERDQIEEEVTALKKKGDSIDPAELDARADERAEIKGVAHHLKVDGYDDKPNTVIKAMIVQARNPDLKMDGMDPMVIEGRYQAICDTIRSDNKSLQSLAALKQITSSTHQDGDRKVTDDDDKSPRQKYVEDLAGMHTMTAAEIEKKWAGNAQA